jgi:hypothetical protein
VSRALFAAHTAAVAVVARFACCVGVLVCYAIRCVPLVAPARSRAGAPPR